VQKDEDEVGRAGQGVAFVIMSIPSSKVEHESGVVASSVVALSPLITRGELPSTRRGLVEHAGSSHIRFLHHASRELLCNQRESVGPDSQSTRRRPLAPAGRLRQRCHMDLTRFPRRRYTPGPTPIEPLPRLGATLGIDLWVKRDDLLGLAGGGNKTRKLEFLVADALSGGADTLVTVGSVQSNHCRLTAAAAAREGLKCRLILEERNAGTFDADAVGNHLLFDLLGVEAVRVIGAGRDLAAELAEEADAVAQAGGKAHLVVGGGSSPLGALGYAAAAQEIVAQAFDRGQSFDHLVVTSGSAGTHAGLLAGLAAAHAALPVTGISVRRPSDAQRALVADLAGRTAALAGGPTPAPETVVVDDRFVGPGYALPTAGMVEAVRLAARLEGLLLDPVYTGKAMAGLIAHAREGRIARGERVLFLHTGGAPSLHAFAADLRDPTLQPRA
jgi:D-cysteine desulfhydrase